MMHENVPWFSLGYRSSRILHLLPARVYYRGVSMGRHAVVFGAAGQLGTELVRELRQRRFTVMAWDRFQVDITDPLAVQDALANCDAEVVFNAAAYNQVDVAEKEPLADRKSVV